MSRIKKKHWVMAVDKPDDIAIQKYVGRFVKCKDDDGKDVVVEIESIQGNMVHATKFQINSYGKSYLISMLDFFAQMNGEKVSEEEIKLFDETMFEVRSPLSNQFMKHGALWQRAKPYQKN